MTTTKLMRHVGEREQEPLHYKDCGLDDVYLLSGYTREEYGGEEGISIKNLDELHKAIGTYLATQKKALSGKEYRFLRKQMDLTQSELGKFMGLSSQQVARWEKGECEISGPADLLVRVLYIHQVVGKLDIQKLSADLDEFDSHPNEKVFFERTAHGWRYKQAA